VLVYVKYCPGYTLLATYNYALTNVLTRAYPTHDWDANRFIGAGREAPILRLLQRHFNDSMLLVLSKLNHFSLTLWIGIEEHVKIFKTLGGNLIELDYFISSAKKAIEYQGEQHFFDVRTYGLFETQLNNDIAKAALVSQSGIGLVEIPYWERSLDQRKLEAVFNRLNSTI